MPLFSAMMMFFLLSNAGLPGTSGFVGEFMVLISTMEANFWVTLLAGLTLVLSASYSLFMFKRVFYGPITINHIQKLTDITTTQQIALWIMTAGIFFIGLYPQSITHMMDPSVNALIQASLQSKV